MSDEVNAKYEVIVEKNPVTLVVRRKDNKEIMLVFIYLCLTARAQPGVSKELNSSHLDLDTLPY